MNGLKIVLYGVAVLASVTCTALLFRGYRQRHVRLLMWSSICFAGLSVNNIVLFLDLVVFPETDLRLARLLPSLVGMLFLLYGFVWDAEGTKRP